MKTSEVTQSAWMAVKRVISPLRTSVSIQAFRLSQGEVD
jgi:hypothetical protein